MYNEVADASFLFKLEQMDEVTLCWVGCSLTLKMVGHEDTLEG